MTDTTLPLLGDVAAATNDTGAVNLTPTVDGTAGAGDVVFCHVMFPTPDIELDATGDWTILSTVNAPTYTSILLWVTLAGEDDLELDWESSHSTQPFAYQTVALEDVDDVEGTVSLSSLGGAVLPRHSDTSAQTAIHMLCFAGSLNLSSKLTVSAHTDVSWMTTLDVENDETAGMPVLWCGEFPGPLDDSDMTLNAAVHYDPAPTHSVGHTVALELSAA